MVTTAATMFKTLIPYEKSIIQHEKNMWNKGLNFIYIYIYIHTRTYDLAYFEGGFAPPKPPPRPSVPSRPVRPSVPGGEGAFAPLPHRLPHPRVAELVPKTIKKIRGAVYLT